MRSVVYTYNCVTPSYDRGQLAGIEAGYRREDGITIFVATHHSLLITHGAL
jgi:hypothetical protein